MTEHEVQIVHPPQISEQQSVAPSFRATDQAAKEAQAKIRATFRDLGIPEAWAPASHVAGTAAARTLRTSAGRSYVMSPTAEAERRLRAAETEIKRRSVEAEERVTIAGLSSEAARAMLETLPTPAQLMPELEFEAIERIAVPDRTGC